MEDSLQKEAYPLQQFLQDDRLAMLESILPHIGDSLRMPLALSIKLLEIRKILTEFDDEEKLSACGIDNNSPNLESLLIALRKNSSQETAKQIDQILAILNISKMYQTYSEVIKSHPELFPQNSNLSGLNAGSQSNQEMLMKLLPLLMSNQNNISETAANSSANRQDNFIDNLSEILRSQELILDIPGPDLSQDEEKTDENSAKD